MRRVVYIPFMVDGETARLRKALAALVYKSNDKYYTRIPGDSDVTDIVDAVLNW